MRKSGTWKAASGFAGFTLTGSTWDSAGGIFGGGSQSTIAAEGASIGTRRITPTAPGRWCFTLNGVWAENSTGMRQSLIRRNGVSPTAADAPGNYAGVLVPAQGRSEFSMSMTTDMNGSTDYVDFSMYQTSGTRLTLTWVSLTAEVA